MTLREDEWRLLRQAARRPDDEALRRVLADRLLEADEPLGELLQLEAEEGELHRRRALELELRSSLKPKLVPWARELELDRGLPSWALFDPSIGRNHLFDGREPWPIRALSVVGDLRESFQLLSSPVIAHVEQLDLSRVRSARVASQPAEGALPSLPNLVTVSLPSGALPKDAVETLQHAFASVKVLEVGVGPGFELPAWLLELPAVERLRLLPSREPGDGMVFANALQWAEERRGRCLEWLGELYDAKSARHEWTPGLPGDRPALPEEVHERLELTADPPGGRIVRAGDRVLLRCDDAPAADVFAAPPHRALVAPRGLVRVRRALHVEFDAGGAAFPLRRHSVTEALELASWFAGALRAWWSDGAPDAVTGEWVAIGRDQLRRRTDGTVGLVPVLSRRMGPEAHHLLDVVGTPFRWNRTEPAITALTAAAFVEWVSGEPFLDARVGSAAAVHQRLTIRLAHPPRVPELGDVANEALRTALGAPARTSASDLLAALSQA